MSQSLDFTLNVRDIDVLRTLHTLCKSEGKGKVFENAEDFIADLRKGRKKGSVGVEK